MGKIRRKKGKLIVPPNLVIPTIRGDGIGADITPVMIRVIDAAVHQAYRGERKITWKHVLAGEEALEASGLTEEKRHYPYRRNRKYTCPSPP